MSLLGIKCEVAGGDKAIKVLTSKLVELKKKFNGPKNVTVGYSAHYAIYVHENLEAKHKPGRVAKYLEQPAKEMKDELAKYITSQLKRGVNPSEALLKAGLRLQRASQKIVPVDTGYLRRSAFTKLEY